MDNENKKSMNNLKWNGFVNKCLTIKEIKEKDQTTN